MATSTELPDYINEQPRHGQKCSSNTNQTERRIPQLLLLSFGVLCILQAVLNISLRLSLNSSQESAPSVCNTTTNQNKKMDVVNDCERKKTRGFNSLQERFSALTRETNRLQNRNSILNNMISNVKEERDQLKRMIREQRGCVSSQQCPTGWIEMNSRCYFQSTDFLTWEESRNYCKSQGADLVVINSEQELLSLGHLTSRFPEYWIGLHRTNGDFRWVDGSALTKESWEPVDLRSSYKCVSMNLFTSVQDSWSTAPCRQRHLWLCETDLCPPSP
ncbi:asialoglycoprotein receptor 1-like [Hippoglossus hippoglossus]|uniref:asialoglycoprotein receptor 1-like n=1 Tax=Hippoglossus hippoglossus TaxID=8267 RepID=UPI00148C4C57|nr:asialoglycoprotein receptor 1-like [Hippoglossus hippoglossus]